jgi:biopolymer transport protein ExbB/TolQ
MTESRTAPKPPAFQKRAGTALPAFVVGVPLAAGVLSLFHFGPLKATEAARYVSHRVECVEVLLFCCAISALGFKLWNSRRERAACRRAVLPPWDGAPAPVEEAPLLLAELGQLPYRLRNTYLVCRVAAVLDFLCSRRSADDLDDQLRTLTDNDALALEGSYALTRFITWAIPILGFLGTVLGITGAISGVTPDKLEKDLSQVTDGLALAFDATALGLALTMATMFLSFLTERTEQGVLDAVDQYVDRQLAHRFERAAADSGAFVAVVRQNTQVLLQATEQLVQRQADVWAKAFEQAERQRQAAVQQQQQQFTAAIESALEKTLEAHTRRLAGLERQMADQGAGLLEKLTACAHAARDAGREQQAALAPLAQAMAAQAAALSRLQDGEKQLLQLQQTLNQNLAALVGALQGCEFRISAADFRVRLEPQEMRPELRLARPGKAA